jgi:hypothetical protein
MMKAQIETNAAEEVVVLGKGVEYIRASCK